MPIIKKIGFIVSGFLLRSALFFGFTLLATVIVIGNRENIKNLLVDQNAYSRFSQSVVDASKEQAKNDPDAPPLDNPRVENVLKSSLSQETTLPIAEGVIDSTYNWLEGDTQKIEFSADLTKNREILANGIADYAVDRIESLPPCTSLPEDNRVFKIECNPTSVDKDQLRDEIYKSFIKDTSVFKYDKLTVKNFLKLENGNTLDQEYDSAPTYYSYFKVAPYAMLFVAVILSVIIIFLSPTKVRGLRYVSTSLLGTGLILAIFPILYVYVFSSSGFSLPGFGSASSSESVSAISNDVANALYKEVNLVLINIAIQVLVAGVILFFISRYLTPVASKYDNLEQKAGLSNGFAQNPSNAPKTYNGIPIQTSEDDKVEKANSERIRKNN